MFKEYLALLQKSRDENIPLRFTHLFVPMKMANVELLEADPSFHGSEEPFIDIVSGLHHYPNDPPSTSIGFCFHARLVRFELDHPQYAAFLDTFYQSFKERRPVRITWGGGSTAEISKLERIP